MTGEIHIAALLFNFKNQHGHVLGAIDRLRGSAENSAYPWFRERHLDKLRWGLPEKSGDPWFRERHHAS
jgi:hypothetical protein